MNPDAPAPVESDSACVVPSAVIMTIWHVGANDFRACSTSRPDRVGQLGIYQRDSGRLMRFYPRTGRFGGADLMHLKTLAFQHLAKRPAKEFVCIHDQDDRRLFETLVRTLLTSGHCPTAIAKFLPPRGVRVSLRRARTAARHRGIPPRWRSTRAGTFPPAARDSPEVRDPMSRRRR